MIRKIMISGLAGLMLVSCSPASNVNKKEQEISNKVESLLQQMTLEEKLEQMMQDAPKNERLGIPVMTYTEALHGLWLEGATVFPQAIGLGSTWEPELLTKMNSYVAKEARSIGVTHCYSPNLDVITGDPRYGRVEESYGEDPYLVSRMGVAFINGLQGEGEERFDENHVIATAKHFAGYTENRTGINGAFTDISPRRMYEIHFPSFEAAVKEAKVGSIMPAHHDLNGVPCHMNTWLLQDVLRKDWGFDGFLISDNNDVGRLKTMHYVASNKAEAAVLALKAGVDMELVIGKFKDKCSYIPEVLKDTLEKDPSLMKYVDACVKNILTAKYRLGLFEKEPVTKKKKVVESSKEAQEYALQVARKSIILLKNNNDILPLDKNKINSIAVIGPNASEKQNGRKKYLQLGSYAGIPPYYTSILEGIQEKVGKKVKVNYAQGCGFWEESKEGFAEAISAARRSDVVVLAVGSSCETCGEGIDRDNIDLVGVQSDLIKAISATGKPIIMVLINGRPLAIEEEVKLSDAVIEGWYPGMRTGEAIADVLFGDYNPGGKLTVSFPRNIGQIPMTYLLKPDFIGTGGGQYKHSSKQPLFPFGYGLSYTTFEYDNIRLSSNEIKAGESVKVSIDLTNSGKRDGEEVVQLYVRDDFASVGRYMKMLKGFKRIALKAGETKTVDFELNPEAFELYDINLKKVIEPGTFTIYVGASSLSKDLKTVKLTIEK